MNYEAWIKKNVELLGSKYEKLFVENVLARIDSLDFSVVRAQFPFRDADNKQRYCDFILAEGDEIRIAIEVDGYDKKGTGQGMTREEFIDWQRRQAALTSQGWFVLRFANTDVRDHPNKCKEHIELLLRNERLKKQHQSRLSDRIYELTKKLRDADITDVSQASLSERTSLQAEIGELKRQLKVAEETKPLKRDQELALDKFLHEQKKINEVLTSENRTMKTTIWAFSLIISVLIISFTLMVSRNTQNGPITSLVNPPEQLNSAAADIAATRQDAGSFVQQEQIKIGHSCENPVSWRNVDQYLGDQIAFLGPVVSTTQRKDVQGQPTWIEIGRSFPDPQRVTLVIWGNTRGALEADIAQMRIGQNVCIVGVIEQFRGFYQVVIRSGSQIEFF